MKKTRKRDVLFFGVILLLVLAMLYSGLRIMESTVLHSGEDQVVVTERKTIERNGVEYFPRQDITVVMVLGIDQEGPVVSSNSYRNTGSADSVMLLVFDEIEETCTVLYLNRDTMVDMDMLGLWGEHIGTTNAQLALAHTYGSGLEDSCENVKNTLMNFIHGLTIDYYVAMNMDAIPVLNDAVGGVTVTVTDDFSMVNPTITMGELTLRGDQVLDYVQTRKNVGDQKNVTRMRRQREYVDAFLKALYEKAQLDTTFLISAYEDVSPYIVTDCSVNTLSAMLDRYADFAVAGAVTPEGENVVVDGHYQFHVDEEKLDALILEIFYRPKK